MKVITLNTNGIRAAARKGFFAWLSSQHADADIICIQETKAQIQQLTDDIFYPPDYHCTYVDAQKKGYSGVAIYAKQKPQRIHTQLGWDPADSEGRFVQVDYKNISFISLYMPSGSSGEERQQVKYAFLDKFEQHMQQWINDSSREFVISADWNICHRETDLKNWRANRKNSGFLPEERAWLDKVYDEIGWTDAFREIYPEEAIYTWWSNRGQAWANNVGWRLDYQLVSKGLIGKARSASVYCDERFSDHAPLIMEYDYSIKL